VVLLATLSISSAQTTQENTWSDVSRGLSSDDVEERRNAAIFMAHNKPEDQSSQFLVPLLKQALGDNDPQVRGYAVAATNRFAYVSAIRLQERTGEVPPRLALAEDKELLFMLLARAKDTEAMMGREPAQPMAVDTLGLIFWPYPELPKALAELYESNKDASIRRRVLEAIRYGKLDAPETNPILMEAIGSDDPGLQQSAAFAMERVRPEGAIPALLRAYIQTDNIDIRRSMLMALRAFGEEASDALPELQRERDRLVEQVRRAEELIAFIENPAEFPPSLDPPERHNR
jgi:HEAT repeat protein